jgi:hypothetical protein
MDPLKDYADIARDLEGFLNLQPLLNSIQAVLNDYFPAAYLIAFVLLVVGTMREFLFPETRRFMQNLLRPFFSLLISFLPSFIDWCDQAFKALAELPAAQTIAFGDSRYAIKPGSEGSNVTEIEQVLESKIAVSNAGAAGSSSNRSAQMSPQLSWNPLDFGKSVETAWNYVVGRGVNLVWQILFAIYLLCLLLCKFIILLMQFLQKVTIIGFKLYAPIGVAEYAHHSLKSKSVAFFLTFAGVMTWPVCWSIVNAVTLGILKSIPGPQDQNFATLIVAIVLAIPVLLWVAHFGEFRRVPIKPSEFDLDLLRLDGQGHPALRSYLKARGDRFADIFQRFFAALALTNAARDRGAFSDPNTVFVPLQRSDEFHKLTFIRFDRSWEVEHNDNAPIVFR